MDLLAMRLLFGLWVLVLGSQTGCLYVLKEEQKQVMDQLNREVLALQARNERLSEQVETCDQDEGPNEVYQELRQLLGSTELQLSSEGTVTLVMIPGGLLFSPNSIQVRQEASMVLDLLSAVLGKHSEHRVQITGHVVASNMNSSMRRRHASHWEYASSQAASVMHHLVREHGLDAQRFTISSRGSVEPLEEPLVTDRRFPDWRLLIQIIPPQKEADIIPPQKEADSP
jgi:flagellar motor protein MotB